jgi:phospholipid transport system substrate-binding protein
MRTSKWMSGLTVLAIGWMAIASTAYAGVSSDPVGLLKYIADNMISQLRDHKATLKTKPAIVYSIANRYVVPYADLPEMSKRVLPPKVWNSATASQKAQFQKEFTKLVIRTYASALTSYQDQQVKFFPVRGGAGGNVEVKSEITSSTSSPVTVTYRLLRSGSGWKLYDMSVEGISLISSFRSQFADILANGNMNDLLARLSSHNSG